MKNVLTWIKETIIALFILLFCLSLPASANGQSADLSVLLTDFKNGTWLFSDSSSQLLPHWQDTAYTTFVFVRHCEKVLDGSNDPDLTPEGYARAERLSLILDGFLLDTAYSTNYNRTKLTAKSVQEKAQLPPVQLYEPGGQEALLTRLLLNGKGKRFLVVGHQNTVPHGINFLKNGANYQMLGDKEYDKLFVVHSNGDHTQTEIIELKF